MRITFILLTMSALLFMLSNHHKQSEFEAEYNLIPTNKEIIHQHINKYASLYNVEPEIIVGIIAVESNFNPRAKNPKSSSYGLGQCLKRTGEWIAKEKLKYKYYIHHNEDIDLQVHMTVWYYQHLLKKYKGNKIKALTAYNGFEYPYGVYAEKVYKKGGVK